MSQARRRRERRASARSFGRRRERPSGRRMLRLCHASDKAEADYCEGYLEGATLIWRFSRRPVRTRRIAFNPLAPA